MPSGASLPLRPSPSVVYVNALVNRAHAHSEPSLWGKFKQLLW